MTLDEKIQDFKTMAKNARNDIIDSDDLEPQEKFYNSQLELYAKEHEQLADWLEELSRRRVEELFRNTNEKAIRDKAIDDFQEWIKTQIVGLDTTTNEILVAVDDRWELAIDKFKERVSND